MNNIWFRDDVSDAEWAAHAAECRAEARRIEQDKFRIYEEDGYAFYHNGMMDRAFNEARLADNKGIDSFFKLLDMNGEVVDARIVDGKFGKVWCVKKDDGSVEWVNVSQAQDPKREAAHYAKKGYQVAWVEYRAAYGKSGSYPLPDAKPISIEIVE